MKKLFILLLSLIILTGCGEDNPAKKVKEENLQEAQQKLEAMNKFPKMEFQYTEVDFGKHKEGEVLDTVFVFKNTGEAPLIISKVKTSCGCTASDWPRDPVMPGDEGKIAVEFNTRGKSGKQTKTITIHSNVKEITTTLKIHAMVERDPNHKEQKTSKIPNLKKFPPELAKPSAGGERP